MPCQYTNAFFDIANCIINNVKPTNCLDILLKETIVRLF